MDNSRFSRHNLPSMAKIPKIAPSSKKISITSTSGISQLSPKKKVTGTDTVFITASDKTKIKISRRTAQTTQNMADFFMQTPLS